MTAAILYTIVSQPPEKLLSLIIYAFFDKAVQREAIGRQRKYLADNVHPTKHQEMNLIKTIKLAPKAH